MDKQIYNLKFDMTTTRSVDSGVILKQGDGGDGINGVRLILLVEKNGVKYFDASDIPSIVFRRPNNSSVIGTVSATTTQYYYDIKGSELQYAGKVFVDIKFNESTARESTYTSIITVEQDTINGSASAADIYTSNYKTLIEKETEIENATENYATIAKEAVSNVEYGVFSIDGSTGNLVLTKTEKLDNIVTFSIKDNQRLEATFK